MKMSGFLSVLLVISATLMFTAKGQSNYDMLREVEKKYFDMVIKYANDNFKLQKNQPNKEHLNFERRLGEAVITEQEVKMNLILKATVCSKATNSDEHKHHSDCKFIEKNRERRNMSTWLLDIQIKKITFGNKQLNKEHLNFERIAKSVIKPQEVQINLFLKATSCPKATQGSEHKHRSDCTFIEKKRPFINCVVCHKDFTSTKAFIDCIRHQDVKTRKDIRNKECSSPSNRKPGEGSLLGSTAKMDDLQAGCFGCH